MSSDALFAQLKDKPKTISMADSILGGNAGTMGSTAMGSIVNASQVPVDRLHPDVFVKMTAIAQVIAKQSALEATNKLGELTFKAIQKNTSTILQSTDDKFKVITESYDNKIAQEVSQLSESIVSLEQRLMAYVDKRLEEERIINRFKRWLKSLKR